jgi:hypothetical protein
MRKKAEAATKLSTKKTGKTNTIANAAKKAIEER